MSNPAEHSQPAGARPKVVRIGRRTVSLPALAIAQRRINWVVLAIYAACLVLPAAYFGLRALSMVYVGVVILALFAALNLAAIAFTAVLSHRIGSHPALTVIASLSMLVPGLNVFVLILVNAHATTMLRRAGVRVGLMGVPPRHLNRLYEGVCTNCGYDLTGIDALECPECGHPVVCTATQFNRGG